MPTSPTASTSTARKSSRTAAQARKELLAQLKDDHQRVKRAYNKYRRLDAEEDAEIRQGLVQQVLDELSVHARLEEELLYPAAKKQLEDCRQIDEAEVEHEMLHLLIDQLRDLDPEAPSHEQEQHARFTVLCEYTLHHVKEEEREMFPQLMKARLDWLALARETEERRTELKGQWEGEADGEEVGERVHASSPDENDREGGDGTMAPAESGSGKGGTSRGEGDSSEDCDGPAEAAASRAGGGARRSGPRAARGSTAR